MQPNIVPIPVFFQMRPDDGRAGVRYPLQTYTKSLELPSEEYPSAKPRVLDNLRSFRLRISNSRPVSPVGLCCDRNNRSCRDGRRETGVFLNSLPLGFIRAALQANFDLFDLLPDENNSAGGNNRGAPRK
jgi:hypothetical protein